MTRRALQKQIEDLDCQLSPENLCGDGEFSRSYVDRRVKELLAQRKEVVSRLSACLPPTANLEITIA